MTKIMFCLIGLIVVGVSVDLYRADLQAQSKRQKNQKIIDEMLVSYQKEGAKKFSAKRGAEMWTMDMKARGKIQNCTLCHNKDLALSGKHYRTGKVIAPMAAWTTPDRFTDKKKIKKWFKQNCNTTWGRDCTLQEKGDFLSFFREPLKKEKKKEKK